MAISELFVKNQNRIANVVVPHNAAKSVWEKVKEDLGLKRVRVLMAHTYFNLPTVKRRCDLLIVDEGHRFTNEEAKLFSRVIKETDNRFVMVLSATFSLEQKKFMRELGLKEAANVDMREAKLCDYVAKHTNYWVNCNLLGQDLRAMNELDEAYHESWSIFEKKWDLVQNCMKPTVEGDLARNYVSELQGIPPDHLYGLAKTAMEAMRHRKVFLQKAPCKQQVVKNICELHKGKKIITFGEYTDFADELTSLFGARARSYHSSIPSQKSTITKRKYWKTERGRDNFYDKNKGKLAVLEKIAFNGKEYGCEWKVKKPISGKTIAEWGFESWCDPNSGVDILNTCKALDEAKDVDNVEVGIVWSFSKNSRQMVQRFGRTIRFAEGKVAYLYFLVLKRSSAKTQEQRWAEQATINVDFEIVNDYELQRQVDSHVSPSQ